MEIIVVYIFGTTGIILVLVAYFLLQAERWKFDSAKYLASNALGSLLLLSTNYYEWNLASFTLNFSWLLISLYGIYKRISRFNKEVE